MIKQKNIKKLSLLLSGTAVFVGMSGMLLCVQSASGETKTDTLKLIDVQDNVTAEKNAAGIHLYSSNVYTSTLSCVFTGNAEVEFTIDGNAGEWTENGLALEHIYNFRIASTADSSVYFDIAYQYLDDQGLRYKYGPSWAMSQYTKESEERTAQMLVPVVYYKEATMNGENFVLRTRYSDKKETDWQSNESYHDEFYDRSIRWDTENRTAGDFYYKAHGSTYDKIDPSAGCFSDIEKTKFSIEWSADGYLCVYNYRTNDGTLEKYIVAKFDDGAYFCGLPNMEIMKQGYTVSLMSDCEYATAFKRTQNVTNNFDYGLLPYYDYDDISNNLPTNLGITIHKIIENETVFDCAEESFTENDGFKRYVEFIGGKSEIVFPDYYTFKNVGVGNRITVPVAVYRESGKEQSYVSDITILRKNDGITFDAESGGEYVIESAGEYEIIYKAGTAERHIAFTAIEYGFNIADVVSGYGFTKKETAAGLEVEADSNNRYRVDFAGVFDEKFNVRFRLKTQIDKYSQGDNVIAFRVSDSVDPNVYFDVAYYRSRKNASSFAVSVAYETGNTILYRGTVPGGGNTCEPGEIKGFAPTERAAVPNGYGDANLSIAKEHGIYKVYADGIDGKKYMIAAFDGSYDTTLKNYGFTSAGKWGLPKLAFKNGFTVSLRSYCDTQELNGKIRNYGVLLKNLNGVDLCGVGGVVYQPEFDVKISGSVEKGDKIYVPAGIGKKIISVYRLHFANDKSWRMEYETSNESVLGFDPFVCGEQTLTATGEYLKENLSGGKTMTTQKNVVVERARKISFDTDGGNVVPEIVYSENTFEAIEIPLPYRYGYEFLQWKADGIVWDGKAESLSKDENLLVAQWKYTGMPTITLKEGLKNAYLVNETILISSNDISVNDFTGNLKYKFSVKSPDGSEKAIRNGSKVILESGEYIITYKVTDSKGVSSELQRQIHVGKNIAPTIIAAGSLNSDYVTGNSVKLPKAYAIDSVGKEIPAYWIVTVENESIAVNERTFIARRSGMYRVRCIAVDERGNVGYLEYEIAVSDDTMPPVIRTDLSDYETTVGETVALPEIVAVDNADENVIITVKVSFGISEISLENSTFVAEKRGVYRVLIIATDASGNRTMKTVFITAK